MEKELEELKELIREKLAVCDTNKYPVLCRIKQIKGGVDKIEEMVVYFALEDEMPVTSALAHIELEFKEILNNENIKMEEI